MVDERLFRSLITVVGTVAIVFYWGHCARPALLGVGARPRTLRVVQAVGGVAIAAGLVTSYFRFWLGTGTPASLVVLDVVAVAWYVAAWPLPGLVARLSGGVDQSEALRRLLWRLNWTLRGPKREERLSRDRAVGYRRDLERFPRDASTEQLIDLWCREADASLLNGPDAMSDRHGAIADLAVKIWPNNQAWEAVTPFRLR